MEEINNKIKIESIKKYYSNVYNFLDLSLINYEGYNLYIAINYFKKENYYKLSWFNLDMMKDVNVEKYLSCTYIPNEDIEKIIEKFSNYIVNSLYEDIIDYNLNIVSLNANIKTKVDKKVSVIFQKYLPKSLTHLFDLFVFIFNYMPKEYNTILFEVLAKIFGNTRKYEYKDEFDFDLYHDDIDKLFDYHIAERGKRYYDEARVKFLEKIDNQYISIVEGNENIW